MDLDDLRNQVGARLKKLRNDKRWTQKELAAKVGIGYSHLNKYESGIYLPPTDKLICLANLFDTTVDYLLYGQRVPPNIQHTQLAQRFAALSELPAEEMATVLQVLDALILKNKVEGTLRTFNPNQFVP